MKALLNKLKGNNILLEVVDGELKMYAASADISSDIISEIKKNKDELIQYILSNGQDASAAANAGSGIPVAMQQNGYPLSAAQKRIWIVSQFENANIAYNMTGVYMFGGNLRLDGLEYALSSIFQRHESLRTAFLQDENGEIKQVISEQFSPGFSYVDLREREDHTTFLDNFIDTELNAPFDLSSGHLLRTSVLQLADDKWIFTYTMHHIIGDRWSMGILINELVHYYNAFLNEDTSPLVPLRIQYKDYAVWQQHQLKGAEGEKHKDFWVSRFSGEVPVLELPVDYSRTRVRTYRGGLIKRSLPSALSRQLQRFSQDQGATTFMALLAAVYGLLYRYTGQEDIVAGSPIAARDHKDLEDQIGFYVNTLPLRIQHLAADSYRSLLLKVKDLSVQAYEHQLYPLDELVDALQLRSTAGRNPLFDVLVELRLDYDKLKVPQMEGVEVALYKGKLHSTSKFDLSFFITDSGEGFELQIEYSRDIYRESTVERMAVHFQNLLQSMLHQPDAAIGTLQYLTPDEQELVLRKFNDTAIHYPRPGVLDLFQQQVKLDPLKPAVLFNGTILSYEELDQRADQLAGYLLDNCQIKRGDYVGILLDRSEKMIISILGVLKSGAAYVPIDPGYPRERKNFMIRDTGIKVLITQLDYVHQVDYDGGSVIAADVQFDVLANTVSPVASCEPDDIAYIIYTSGTTGLPKGCMISHKNLANYVCWADSYYFPGSQKPDFGLYTSLSFDLTITSIFCCLTRGGLLTVFDERENLQDVLYRSFSKESGINSIKITPSHLNLLADAGLRSEQIDCAIIGGEEVTAQHVALLKEINPRMRIYNEYGPTETTVGCVVAPLEADTPIVIGSPIANTSVYVLDANRMLCAPGITGDIFIAGQGVGAGYLNNPVLTADKFVDDPFNPGNKMYNTGDSGRWRPDGQLEFLGRRDGQVKIRGYRVETGEIEQVLLNNPLIRDAVVVPVGGDGGNDLVLYYTLKSMEENGGVSPDILRTWLKERLPAYMIPLHFVKLDSIPLTPHGKADRKALATGNDFFTENEEQYVAPRNVIEEKLVMIWCEVLGAERIGVRDNFFELGGNSIRAIRLSARINREFNIDINLDRLFNNPTIEEVAHEIDRASWVNRELLNMESIDNAEKFSI